MKKAISLVVFSLLCLNSFCQLLDTGNQWNFMNIISLACAPLEKCSSSYYEMSHYKIGNDTIIHNKVYKKVLLSQDGGLSSMGFKLCGFLREDENHKKAYTLLTNYSDFTVKKDSVFTSTFQYLSYQRHIGYIPITNTFFTSKVIDVDSIEYAGVKRLRIRFAELLYNGTKDSPENITWIEGIGSPQGLINYEPSNNIFLCFKHNDEVMYTLDNGYDCSFVPPPYVDVKNIVKPDVLIFPNPSPDGNVSIKNNDESTAMKHITLYNSQGVKQYDYFPNSSYFQLKNIKPGIYVLELDNVFHKLIVQ